MKSLFERMSTWFLAGTSELIAIIEELPDFMVGKLIELLGVFIASLLVTVFSTLYVDKKREIQKVKARVLDMRLEQYDAIRAFVEDQGKTTAFPENVDDVKSNFEISGLLLENNEGCYSSQGIATEQKISQVLVQLENLTINGLYVLDDDVLGILLQIKIYVKNLNMFSMIMKGYYNSKKSLNKKILRDDRLEEVNAVTAGDIDQISELYFHHLSILLNNEYQDMIENLQNTVIQKASKPKFERKEKNYRKIKTRQRLQDKALNKTILRNKFPKLIHALASLCSAHFQESVEKRENTIKEFFVYAVDIIRWQDRGTTQQNNSSSIL